MYGKINKNIISQAIAKIKKTGKAVTLRDGGRLELRLSKSNIGKGSWSFMYNLNGRGIRVTLGHYIHKIAQSMQPEEARIAAYEIKKELSLGKIKDMISLRQPKIKVGDLWEKFVIFKKQTWTKKTFINSKSSFVNLKKYGIADLQVNDLKIEKLRELYLPLYEEKPSACNLSHVLLINIINFSEKQQILDFKISVPPFTSIFPKGVKHEPRKMLNPKDIPTLIDELIVKSKKKTSNKRYCVGIIANLLVPLRINELLRYRPNLLDENNYWIIPSEYMKNKQPHLIYIDPRLRACLDKYKISSYLSLRKFKESLSLDFDFHGFRSLFATEMLNKSPEQNVLISECLAHQSASYAAASDRAYFRHDLREKKKQILTEWFDHVCSISKLEKLLEILSK